MMAAASCTSATDWSRTASPRASSRSEKDRPWQSAQIVSISARRVAMVAASKRFIAGVMVIPNETSWLPPGMWQL